MKLDECYKNDINIAQVSSVVSAMSMSTKIERSVKCPQFKFEGSKSIYNYVTLTRLSFVDPEKLH